MQTIFSPSYVVTIEFQPNYVFLTIFSMVYRGRSLSPSVNKSRQEVGVGTPDCNRYIQYLANVVSTYFEV